MRAAWICAVIGAIAFALVPYNLGFALLWCCLWFGMAIFCLGAQRRFPGFVRLPPPALLDGLGIPKDSLSGGLDNPWYVPLMIGTLWLCVMAVPLLVPETALIGFAIPIALTLLGLALWLGLRQRAAAKVARALLGAPRSGERRLIGIVRNDEPALVRETFWFDIAGTRRDAEGNETTTSSSYGYQQEQRSELELGCDGETATVNTHGALWAAPPRPLGSAPAIRSRSLASPTSMAGAFIRTAQAWDREELGRGYRVVALGAWDAATRRLSGRPERPVMVYGLGGDRDPVAALRKQLWHRRWPITALCGLAVLAVVAAVAI
jgi:hypothetical protein